MVYLFYLHNSGSRRDVIKHHRWFISFHPRSENPRSQEHQSTIIWWFTFSIYAIETHDFKSSNIIKFFATSSPLHDFFQRGGVRKPKVALNAIPLETPASVKQSIKSLMV
jgi:hypothetical protein